MNGLERWAEGELTRVPSGPAAGELRRRVRARRARRASALAAVAIVVAVLGIAATLHSQSPHHVLVTGPPPIASTTTAPSQSTRPVATASEFPPLAKIISSVTGSVESNGDPKAVVTNPDSAEIVATTNAKAYALWGGTQDDKPIYVVQVTGRFLCQSCSRPPGASAPRGGALQVIFDTSGHTIGFGFTPKPWDLSKLGTVYRLVLPG